MLGVPPSQAERLARFGFANSPCKSSYFVCGQPFVDIRRPAATSSTPNPFDLKMVIGVPTGRCSTFESSTIRGSVQSTGANSRSPDSILDCSMEFTAIGFARATSSDGSSRRSARFEPIAFTCAPAETQAASSTGFLDEVAVTTISAPRTASLRR